MSNKNWTPWNMSPLLGQEKTGQPVSAQQQIIANAKRIKQEAEFKQKSEIETLKQQVADEARAKGEQEGYEQGFAKGREEGFNQGYEEALKAGKDRLEEELRKAVEPIRHLGAGFSEALNDLDRIIAARLSHLGLKIAKQVTLDTIAQTPEMIEVVVRKLINIEPQLVGNPRLRLNPCDLEIVSEKLGPELKSLGWDLIADQQIERGGCKVTSGSGEIDATWSARWESVTSSFDQKDLA